MKGLIVPFALVAWLVSGSARADVDVEVSGGQRTAKQDTSGLGLALPDVKGTEVTAAVHVTPFKAPIAFGVAVSSQSYDLSKDTQTIYDAFGMVSTVTDKMSGMVYGPEVVVWAPLPFLKPFVRVGYLMGTLKDVTTSSTTSDGTTSNETQTTQFTTTGYDYSAGLRFAPAPFVSILVEYNVYNATQKIKTYTDVIDGVSQTLSAADAGIGTTSRFATTGVRLGLQLSL